MFPSLCSGVHVGLGVQAGGCRFVAVLVPVPIRITHSPLSPKTPPLGMHRIAVLLCQKTRKHAKTWYQEQAVGAVLADCGLGTSPAGSPPPPPQRFTPGRRGPRVIKRRVIKRRGSIKAMDLV